MMRCLKFGVVLVAIMCVGCQTRQPTIADTDQDEAVVRSVLKKAYQALRDGDGETFAAQFVATAQQQETLKAMAHLSSSADSWLEAAVDKFGDEAPAIEYTGLDGFVQLPPLDPRQIHLFFNRDSALAKPVAGEEFLLVRVNDDWKIHFEDWMRDDHSEIGVEGKKRTMTEIERARFLSLFAATLEQSAREDVPSAKTFDEALETLNWRSVEVMMSKGYFDEFIEAVEQDE